jgi:hypothetical protein
MIDAAKKYGLQMEVHATTKDTVRWLPIWYHAQADRQIQCIAAHKSSKCLLKKHNILTVGDAEDFASLKLTNGHCESWYCSCAACITIQNTGCESPSDCIQLANNLIETLPTKWNLAGLSDMTPWSQPYKQWRWRMETLPPIPDDSWICLKTFSMYSQKIPWQTKLWWTWNLSKDPAPPLQQMDPHLTLALPLPRQVQVSSTMREIQKTHP